MSHTPCSADPNIPRHVLSGQAILLNGEMALYGMRYSADQHQSRRHRYGSTGSLLFRVLFPWKAFAVFKLFEAVCGGEKHFLCAAKVCGLLSQAFHQVGGAIMRQRGQPA